jgi:hypothetical protein
MDTKILAYRDAIRALNQPRGASRGVNLRVERGAEKRELRGVDKGVMEERL